MVCGSLGLTRGWLLLVLGWVVASILWGWLLYFGLGGLGGFGFGFARFSLLLVAVGWVLGVWLRCGCVICYSTVSGPADLV